MQTFAEHYFLQEKLTSDIRRAFTSNFFKKRKAGIDIGKGSFKTVVPVDASLFSHFKEEIRKEAVNAYRIKKEERSGRKELSKTKKLKLELGKLFVSDAFEGEVDSGSEKLEGTPISSMVYQLNNGGKIGFITTEDSEGYIRQYITTSSKGNDYFREKLGTTIQQIYADSRSSKRLVTKPKSSLPKTSKDMEKLVQDFQKIDDDYPPEEKPEYQEPEESPTEENQEYGVLDISIEEFENLKQMWGTGKKGNIKGGFYPFRGKFTQERYYNAPSNYTGYKYLDNKGHAVYLINTEDEKDAFIGFQDRRSFDWAKDIGMLNFWRNKPGKHLGISWRQGTIDNLE